MRPDHRHELKTNELAEWLTNLPQQASENRASIIVISAVIIAAAVLYILRLHSKDATTQKQMELTSLAGQVLAGRMQILQSQEQGKDISFILLQTAESLKNAAKNTNDNQMAAFAFIKQAETLRTELHYRMGNVSEQEAAAQIDQAKAGYAEALERCSTNPSLTAAAKLGLGLCEEEIGNFDVAKQIYRDITADPNLGGTVAVAQAKIRLETMADYEQKIVFKPAPEPAIEFAQPADANSSPASPNDAPEASYIDDANQSGE